MIFCLGGTMRTGKFEINQDKKKEWRFRLKSSNGRIIATSEGYKTSNGCLKGVYAVMDTAEYARIFIEGKEVE